MDQLKGKIVNVVLTVQEGKSMDLLKSPIHLSANFNGRILDSDPVLPADSPTFNTNLIWEIEKKDLRKIRSSNQPLRVECLSADPATQRLERFGHLLLDLRGAQVVDAAAPVPFRWQKLLGVRQRRRNAQPELFVSLTIRAASEPTPDEPTSPAPAPRAPALVPIHYQDDGFIVIGPAAGAKTTYALHVLIKTAANLDLLLPEVLVFRQARNRYALSLRIFGVPIETKQFTKELHETIHFDERIVVRILSSRQTLREFLVEERIEVGFYSGGDLLGETVVPFFDLAQQLESTWLGVCYFKFPSPNGIVPVSNQRRPSLALEMSLVANGEEEEEAEPEEEAVGELPTDLASGDHCEPDASAEEARGMEEWREEQRQLFMADLERLRAEQVEQNDRLEGELRSKKAELDEELGKTRKMQDELYLKLEEVRLAKELRARRKSSTGSLHEAIIENQRKFENCDSDLLIEYVSKLQQDNESLKEMVQKKSMELESTTRTALTKEQTAGLLQELKGLEEKFHVAQQAKTYFKDQWQHACDEIHELKTEDYKKLQHNLRERREELSQLSLVEEDGDDKGFEEKIDVFSDCEVNTIIF